MVTEIISSIRVRPRWRQALMPGLLDFFKVDPGFNFNMFASVFTCAGAVALLRLARFTVLALLIDMLIVSLRCAFSLVPLCF